MTREEQLQQFAEQYTKGLYLDRHNLIQMVKAGAEWADQHPHWIPVEDGLPKEQDWYLCYNDVEDGSEVLHWEGDGNVWMDNDWHYKSKEITHWMPLPQPPRKEDKK